MVVLVTPIDASAPKGRMILPQVQAIRDILDAGAVCSVTQPEQLPGVLSGLSAPPRLVITDSQAFGEVAKIVPGTSPSPPSPSSWPATGETWSTPSGR